MKLFGLDSTLVRSMNKLMDLLLLNLLWLLCSLPIITIGASTTAAYYVAMKMVKDEEGYIARTFFKEFKSAFKQSTIMWIIMVVLGYFIWLNFSLINAMESAPLPLVFVTVGGTLFYIFAFAGVFPLMARYTNTLRQTIKNSLFITIRHFFHILAMLLVLSVFLLIFWFNGYTLFLGAIIGPGLLIYIASSFYLKIFEKVEVGQAADEQARRELEEENE